MGYFSNGCEGDAYIAEFCARCVHREPLCAVWSLHLLWNYAQHRDETKRVALEVLIPRRDGENQACAMFTARA